MELILYDSGRTGLGLTHSYKEHYDDRINYYVLLNSAPAAGGAWYYLHVGMQVRISTAYRPGGWMDDCARRTTKSIYHETSAPYVGKRNTRESKQIT